MRIREVAVHASTESDARSFLRSRNIIKGQCACSTCYRTMSEVRHRGGIIFRCPTHKGHKVSILSDSILANSNLKLGDFIFIVYFWSHETPVTSVESMTGLTRKTIIQWYSRLRDVCSQQLLEHPIQIGGPGISVEIDESLISRRKYNRGHLVPQRWIFGGIDPVTQTGFLQFVPDRSAETLLPIIQQRIVPGSIIISDEWRAYGNIQQIEVTPSYVHRTVNHSLEFVNELGDTTNHIEAMWNNCKRRFKRMSGTYASMVPSYLDEFMWRQQFGSDADSAFENILRHVSEQFNV